MRVHGLVETLDGTPLPGEEGEVRRLSDNGLIGSVTTNAQGWFTFEMNGSPGPFRIVWSANAAVRTQYSKITGPSASTDIAGLPLLFRTNKDGVIQDVAGQLLISATGAGMFVSIATGAAVVRGVLYDQLSNGTINIDAADSQPRIDVIAVQVVPPGTGEDVEGRSRVVVIKGTPAASPVAPALTQTNSLWEIPLANIAVGGSVSVIGSDKVTDRRTFSTPYIPPGGIGATELADGSVTRPKLAADANSIAYIKESGETKNTVPINRVNFNGAHFDISVNAGFSGQQMDISLASGGGRPLFMPGTEFVATGPIASGTRTLVTFGVGPIPANVPYAVFAYFGFTVRNQVNTGTVVARLSIDGGTVRTHEFQNVGGVPRWAPITQSAVVTKTTSSSFNCVGSVQYNAADPSDIRAGWITVIAIPATVLTG